MALQPRRSLVYQPPRRDSNKSHSLSPPSGTATTCREDEEEVDIVTICIQKGRVPFSGAAYELHENHIEITSVLDTGRIPEWNRDHPENSVKPGDQVIRVNGISGDAQAMLAAIRQNDELEIDLVRTNVAPQQEIKACTSRKPAIGDRVMKAEGHEKCRDGWTLAAGAVATVVSVDPDGDFKLRNPAGMVSKYLHRRYYVYCNDEDLPGKKAAQTGRHCSKRPVPSSAALAPRLSQDTCGLQRVPVAAEEDMSAAEGPPEENTAQITTLKSKSTMQAAPVLDPWQDMSAVEGPPEENIAQIRELKSKRTMQAVPAIENSPEEEQVRMRSLPLGTIQDMAAVEGPPEENTAQIRKLNSKSTMQAAPAIGDSPEEDQAQIRKLKSKTTVQVAPAIEDSPEEKQAQFRKPRQSILKSTPASEPVQVRKLKSQTTLKSTSPIEGSPDEMNQCVQQSPGQSALIPGEPLEEQKVQRQQSNKRNTTQFAMGTLYSSLSAKSTQVAEELPKEKKDVSGKVQVKQLKNQNTTNFAMSKLYSSLSLKDNQVSEASPKENKDVSAVEEPPEESKAQISKLKSQLSMQGVSADEDSGAQIRKLKTLNQSSVQGVSAAVPVPQEKQAQIRKGKTWSHGLVENVSTFEESKTQNRKLNSQTTFQNEPVVKNLVKNMPKENAPQSLTAKRGSWCPAATGVPDKVQGVRRMSWNGSMKKTLDEPEEEADPWQMPQVESEVKERAPNNPGATPPRRLNYSAVAPGPRQPQTRLQISKRRGDLSWH